MSDFHHDRINHAKLFVEGRNQINEIKDFGDPAKKRHWRKFNGIPKSQFGQYLKEYELLNTLTNEQLSLLKQDVKEHTS